METEKFKINIKATDLELTDRIRNYVNEKVSHFKKYISLGDSEEVIIAAEVGKKFGGHHKQGFIYRAEINLDYKGQLYRAETTSEDILASIDETTEEIIKQLRRHKDRRDHLIRRGGRAIKRLLKFGGGE